ncbi:GNAT family N-acetyltransferase [Sulfitobacter sp.]|uniref:GNAT family N-acetyltransferase n=1 Tax=Sulfitobacter sp. TaxID=1903071 RepID=UPI003001FCD7
MQIRVATTDDTSAIAKLWHAQWHSAHGAIVDADLVNSRIPAEFNARTTAHLPQTYVALVDGALAGFFMIEGDELYQFYIANGHQGSGLAQGMMTHAEALLPAPRAWLACSVGNSRAARFYQKCGWQNTGVEELKVETSSGPKPVSIWRFEKDI